MTGKLSTTELATSTIVAPKLSHKNNLDFLRLYFALSVIITHSYALTGSKEIDVLAQFSHGQALMSSVAVHGFLIISGYLITKSMVRSKSIGDYYFKRFLRVFPGLTATVVLSAIICYFFSHKSIGAYLSHYTTRDYVIFNPLLRIVYAIDGVFTDIPYPKAVNGSLWTIPYEVFFYLVLSSCFFIRTKTTLIRAIAIGAFVGLVALTVTSSPALLKVKLPFWYVEGDKIGELGSFFLSGVILSTWPLPSARTRRIVALVTAVLMALSLAFGGYPYLKFLLLPVLVLSFGTLSTPPLTYAGRFGDFSYGIYLWGFFVQQSLIYLFHLSLWPLMAASLLVTYVCGVLSWHLVEKRALRLKMPAQQKRASIQATI